MLGLLFFGLYKLYQNKDNLLNKNGCNDDDRTNQTKSELYITAVKCFSIQYATSILITGTNTIFPVVFYFFINMEKVKNTNSLISHNHLLVFC